ncbi:MAG: hypothetical protein H0X42_12310, partial [Solirubrobacterales bacterium]|nr:hypothetical protein [Solirubrobacterales bacterium]
PLLRRCRIAGPAVVHLAEPLAVRRPLLRRSLVARLPGRLTSPSRLRHRVELAAGETLELRP